MSGREPATVPPKTFLFLYVSVLVRYVLDGYMRKTMTARTLLTLSLLLAGTAPLAAQTLSASTDRLNFIHQRPGGGQLPPGQVVNVTSSVPGTTVRITRTATGAGGNWLVVPTEMVASGALNVVVNPFTVPALDPGTYTGTITLTPPTGTAVNIAVTFVVADTPLIAAEPQQVVFQFSRGGQVPAARPVSVRATAAGITFTAAVTQIQGTGNWLRIEPVNATAGTTQPTTVTLSVAEIANFAVGTYNATVSIIAPGASNNPFQIAVVLQVLEEARLSATPSALSFDFQTGGPAPGDRTLFVTSTSANVAFTVELVRTSGGNWLSVAAANAALVTPQQLTFSANPAGLAPGTYENRIRIISPAVTNSPLEVVATLRVSNNPILTATPGDGLRFSFQTGGGAVPRQAFVVTSTGATTGVTVEVQTTNGGNWLNATPSRIGTPATVSVGVEPASLPAGTYNGNVRLSGDFGNSPINIPVTFVVTGGPGLRVSDNYVSLVHQQGAATAPSRTLQVTSTGAALGVTVSAVSGGGWLGAALSQNTTPANLVISGNAGGLPPGVYTGTVTVAPGDGSSPGIVIPVRLQVIGAPGLIVSTAAIVFNHVLGRTPPDNQSLPIGATQGAIAYTLTNSTADGNPWIVMSRTQGTTGGTDTIIAVNPGALGAGVYTGIIAIASSAANAPIFVPVILIVQGQAQDLTVTPVALTFTQSQGGAAPAAQTLAVRLTPDGRVAFNATVNVTSPVAWLTVNPLDGITPSDLSVTVNSGNLQPGVYVGTITVTPVNAPNVRNILIPVTLTVTTRVSPIVSDREALTFNFIPGGTPPPAQTLAITAAEATQFTVTFQPQSAWLSVAPNTGTTPATLNVSVNPAGLAAGTFTGTITLTPPGAGAATRVINVTLVISQVPAPQLREVVHAATFQPTAVAPGLILTLFGQNMGPAAAAGIRVDANGLVTTTNSGVRVLFDGIPGALIFLSATQINCVAPYALAGRVSTRVQVEYQGVVGNVVELRVVDAVPGIFRLNQAGQGAIVNQNGVVNGAGTAAAKDTIITIYATGDGAVSPPGIDGLVPTTAQQLRRPLLPVRVRIGGIEHEVEYAGSAPGFVAGVTQINVFIRTTVPSGAAVPIDLLVGNNVSLAGTTIAIQ